MPSPDLGLEGPGAGDQPPALSSWQVDALVIDAARVAGMLMALDEEATPPEVALGDDLRFWTVATRFGLELLYRQRLIPTLHKEAGDYVARWRPVLSPSCDPEDHGHESDWQRFNTLVAAIPPAASALAWGSGAPEARPRELLNDYIAVLTDAVARDAMPFGRLAKTRRRTAGEAWLEALQGEPILDATPAAQVAFVEQHSAWSQPADAQPPASDAFRVSFRLDPPDPDDAAKATSRSDQRDWTLRYLLQATDDPSLLVTAETVWRQRGSTARFLDRKFDNPQERLLAGLGRASRLFAPIESSLRAARPEIARLTTAEAYDFVREKALLMKSSGFGVLVPGLETKLGLRVKLGRKSSGNGQSHGMFSWQSVVEYDWHVALGDESLSREEFVALAKLKEPLVQVRGRWVELRPDQIEQALAFFDRQADGGQMSLQEAVKLSLSPDASHGLPIVEVATDGWMDELMRELRAGVGRGAVAEPPGFVGQLREYQKVGLSWLSSLRRFGLGACLADDMGLGKTIEVIATLLHRPCGESQDGAASTLLICPTSVVGNWRRELSRFAPSLRVLVHHGADRNKEEFATEATHHDVVISTYALLHRDETELTGVEWGNVVLDEAQNIKNSSTKAAQAARKLRARWRAALTGTPVENRLADLWSIFHFLNPGYLGSREDFGKRFAEPIERAHDATATARLKALASPFILRRVKSDKSIIADLPEKNEMKVFCSLTKEQVTLYEAVLQESLRQIEETEGMKRRGVVLATLMKLKQLCNHPALFLHDGSQLSGRSGKMSRLGEMLEEVITVGDRALIFSQYAEMGRLLKEHLEEKFGREVLFLHGGTPAPERDRIVARFQAEAKGPHIFVLSLKAGGTGLNLTRANHVFHFDRWWNPAVENQATDRAFRIGQSRDVQVHKFICAGTFEETIDELIEKKAELSQAIVSTSEAWITEMTTDELRGLFALRRDAGEEA